ncbi:MAG: sigma-70 family RNA polymerase sigma factor [Deltaproteobacteria bacterium]|nr:sigma-70 family RNA polymerase sigma factor [Deltaproteobacteria bacterium]
MVRVLYAVDDSPHADPDAERMHRFVTGDPRAFEALYETHKGGVYNFCRRMLAGRADPGEAMQEVFFKVITHAGQWEPRAKFRTWLYTIARNHCHDLLRRPRLVEGDARVGLEAGADGPSVDPRLRALLNDAIAELAPEQREVFLMSAFLEMTFPEIAEIVEQPLNTTKSRMRLAVQHLREALSRAGIRKEESDR